MIASPPNRLTISGNQVGKWLLIVGPRSIRYIMMNVIAGIAEQENVNVLDGGYSPENGDGQFDPIHISMALRKNPEAYARINLMQAATCHQVLALLEQTPSMPVPFVVLDLLNTFYNHTVKIGERKRLLQECLENLNRLEQYAGGTVSVCPPREPSREKAALFRMVEEAASGTYRVEVMIPSPGLKHLH